MKDVNQEDNAVTGKEQTLDALLDDMVEEIVGQEVTEEKKKSEPAGNQKPKESDAPAADKASPEEKPEDLKAELEKLRRDLTAARRGYHEAQTEVNRLKKGSEKPKAASGDDTKSGDEDSDEDSVEPLYKKHLEKLSKDHPDWDEDVLRKKASTKAWNEMINIKAEKIALKALENHPASKAHEDIIVNESAESVVKFVASKDELKDPNSDFYKAVDRAFIERLRLQGAADGEKYLEDLPDGTVRVSRSAHKKIDVKDALERAYLEARGRYGSIARPDPEPSRKARGEDGKFKSDRKTMQSMDDLMDDMTDFSFKEKG